ncbi:hypothetical protein LTR53_010895 [Teratosphaeriaceae sp. CCFEE 6253]|nr:hypothetical protein LTR53_010895 [Teratosphaeriaceae sp. CCFEE 6253]
MDSQHPDVPLPDHDADGDYHPWLPVHQAVPGLATSDPARHLDQPHGSGRGSADLQHPTITQDADAWLTSFDYFNPANTSMRAAAFVDDAPSFGSNAVNSSYDSATDEMAQARPVLPSQFTAKTVEPPRDVVAQKMTGYTMPSNFPQSLYAPKSTFNATTPADFQNPHSFVSQVGGQADDGSGSTTAPVRRLAAGERVRCSCTCGCRTTYVKRMNMSNVQCAPCKKRNGRGCSEAPVGGLRPALPPTSSKATIDPSLPQTGVQQRKYTHLASNMMPALGGPFPGTPSIVTETPEATNGSSNSTLAQVSNNRLSIAMTTPTTTVDGNDPQPSQFMDIFPTEDSADAYRKNKGNSMEYSGLGIKDDDVADVSEAHKLQILQTMFDALLHDSSDPPPAGVDAQLYSAGQAKAMKLCQKTFTVHDGKRASACCTSLYFNAVRLHMHGIPLSLLEKEDFARTTNGHVIERSLKFTARLDSIIAAVKENKRIALDVLEWEGSWDLVCGPKSYLRRKLSNCMVNGMRGKERKASKLGATTEGATQPGSTVDRSLPSDSAAPS